MSERYQPTADDHASVWRASRGRLNQWFEGWADLVRDCELDRYSWSEDEWHNDLYPRNGIAEAWPALTAQIRSVRRAELDDLDDRFRRATEVMGRPSGHAGSDGARWWHNRRPRGFPVDYDPVGEWSDFPRDD